MRYESRIWHGFRKDTGNRAMRREAIQVKKIASHQSTGNGLQETGQVEQSHKWPLFIDINKRTDATKNG